MDFVRKCPKCGYDLTDLAASTCPLCGAQIARPAGGSIWIGALFQFAAATTFMLVFRFPKFMIVAFGFMILIGTLVASRARTMPATRPAPQVPISHPTLLKVLTIVIAIFGFAFVSCLLFGSVIFLNNWNDWHRYEGQPYHHSAFEVRQVYYQKLGKGGVDLYASGNVEGQKEWMSLRPYVGPPLPHDQGELEQRVPVGTEIAIYLFPDMKGRSRVRMYAETPPAESYHRTAVKAANYGFLGMAACAAIIFVLTRLRRMCFGEQPLTLQAAAR